eukprot:COSAG06_NODE_67161_length_252_cov_1.346405_1_plen_23_part_01
MMRASVLLAGLAASASACGTPGT